MNRLAPSGPGGASQEGFRSEPPLSTRHTRCKHAKALEVILVFQSSLLFYIHSDSPVLSLGFQPRVPLTRHGRIFHNHAICCLLLGEAGTERNILSDLCFPRRRRPPGWMLKEKKASLQMKEQQKQHEAALLLHVHCSHAAILHPRHRKTNQKQREFDCSN